MSAEKSAEKQRQQTAWWVPALILFILSLIGIRYASSQGWWQNRFNLGRQTYQTINTGLSVQVPNQANISAEIEKLNPGRPTPVPTSTDQNSKNSDLRRRALW